MLEVLSALKRGGLSMRISRGRASSSSKRIAITRRASFAGRVYFSGPMELCAVLEKWRRDGDSRASS